MEEQYIFPEQSGKDLKEKHPLELAFGAWIGVLKKSYKVEGTACAKVERCKSAWWKTGIVFIHLQIPVLWSPFVSASHLWGRAVRFPERCGKILGPLNRTGWKCRGLQVLGAAPNQDKQELVDEHCQVPASPVGQLWACSKPLQKFLGEQIPSCPQS